MADPQFAKDIMLKAVRLGTNVKAGRARQILDENGVPFGVVSDVSGRPRMIVSREQLDNASFGSLVRNLDLKDPYRPDLVPVESHAELDSIVQERAEVLAINQDLAGIVVQERGDVVGVLLRDTVNRYAQALFGLEGSPMVDSKAYKCTDCSCSKGPEEIDVDYFDPNNPPKCSNGHLMKAT